MPAEANRTLLVICGPTAVGKTDAAIAVAESLKTEIISADSRQLYREIPIGTAQPDADQLSRIRHHFIAERSVTEDYNAGLFASEALQRLEVLFKSHRTVVCCGGTGLYIKALCDGLDDVPAADETLRMELTERFRQEGLGPLQEELKLLDPFHFSKMDVQNPQRVIRALEVCISSGRPFSSFHSSNRTQRPFRIVKIGLELPREELFERINKRVEAMLAAGWLHEAEMVFEQRHLNALNTVGYKELFAHLSGDMTLEEAVEKIKVNTRRFAKRQFTWFKKDAEISWMHPEELASKDLSKLL